MFHEKERGKNFVVNIIFNMYNIFQFSRTYFSIIFARFPIDE